MHNSSPARTLRVTSKCRALPSRFFRTFGVQPIIIAVTLFPLHCNGRTVIKITRADPYSPSHHLVSPVTIPYPESIPSVASEHLANSRYVFPKVFRKCIRKEDVDTQVSSEHVRSRLDIAKLVRLKIEELRPAIRSVPRRLRRRIGWGKALIAVLMHNSSRERTCDLEFHIL